MRGKVLCRRETYGEGLVVSARKELNYQCIFKNNTRSDGFQLLVVRLIC